MDEKFNKLKMFFDYNMKIKKILYNCAPSESDEYNNDYSMVYANKLYESLEDIEYYIMNIANYFLDDDNKKYVNAMLSVFKDELIKCGSDFKKLKNYYRDYFSNMRPDFVSEIKTTCVGYTLTAEKFALIKKCRTINELLNFLHSAVVNNEMYYKDIPIIDRKECKRNKYINLLGIYDELSKRILDLFPTNLDSDEINIMSLGNKIVIMARDLGHALTIEIDVEGDKCMVNYFVPKICNYLMINKLRGVIPVSLDKRYAVGSFLTDIDKLPNDIINFILTVPTDDHLCIPGGLAYYDTNNKSR